MGSEVVCYNYLPKAEVKVLVFITHYLFKVLITKTDTSLHTYYSFTC